MKLPPVIGHLYVAALYVAALAVAAFEAVTKRKN
jgi:hypothetical protein